MKKRAGYLFAGVLISGLLFLSCRSSHEEITTVANVAPKYEKYADLEKLL